ncbi:small subunit ribosomal protein S20 [Actinopolyspora lacussalsi]|uniref:Small ribosomal subunit protein bS20 n=2 Tax=Actinopolyspora alba group TaxID=2893675 RepID=A0A1I1UCE3_9ACTN|nr:MULTISPECIES: 30S ribosomal protein S20 [Actinopolyspora alba group]MDP9644570.1 small subunit ribosomal protein S20 [Actinopolyspora lacussalsi]SFD68354.1 small subunit ribosomal protein S20 [Actinopolyspora alba]SFT53301.1 small subunit ribosomal protein S20 [Actinopolyspora righensis]
MANIKSSKKRVLINERNRLRNKSVKTSMKTAMRRFREAAATGDKEKAAEMERAATRLVDKAAKKGVIHRNQAANKKSSMARQLNQL